MPGRFGAIMGGNGNSRSRLGLLPSGTMGVYFQRLASLLRIRAKIGQQTKKPL